MKAETGLFGYDAYFKVMEKKVHPFQLPSPFHTPASWAVSMSPTFAVFLPLDSLLNFPWALFHPELPPSHHNPG